MKKHKVLPLNTTKQSCQSQSSNCVIWQGPDIPCLNLCKGATITEVIYSIAIKFCEMYEALEPSNYNIDCLDLKPCDVNSFEQIFQAVINKVCTLENGGCNITVSIEDIGENDYKVNVNTNAENVVNYEWEIILLDATGKTATGVGTQILNVSLEGESKTAMLRVTVTDSNGCRANTVYFLKQ